MQRNGSLHRSGSKKYQQFDAEANQGAEFTRKRSLVRPERSRLDPTHPQYHYTQLAQQQQGRIQVQPSSTGLDPTVQVLEDSDGTQIAGSYDPGYTEPEAETYHDASSFSPSKNRLIGDPRDDPYQQSRSQAPVSSDSGYRDEAQDSGNVSPPSQGREVYGLNDEVGGAALSPSRVKSMRKPGGAEAAAAARAKNTAKTELKKKKSIPSLWQVYCRIITFWAPSPLLRLFGMPDKAQQSAWREKIGLISIILYIAAIVAYITFGFSATVCKNQPVRLRNNEVSTGYLIINGRAYDLTRSRHPAAPGIPAGSNVLYPPVNGGGMDASLLFQNVNGNCKGLIKPRENSSIPYDNEGNLAWYMPCQLMAQDGSTKPNFTFDYYQGYACHTSPEAREVFFDLKITADVGFRWDDIHNSSRNLIVYNGNVIDLDIIDFLFTDDVTYPSLFDELKNDSAVRGKDISLFMATSFEKQVGQCLTEIAKVGTIDSDTIGCIASNVVLYVSLIFILSIVGTKFIFAICFKWLVSGKQGAFYMDNKTMNKRNNEIEDWSESVNAQGPIKTVNPDGRRHNRTVSRFNMFNKGSESESGFTTMTTQTAGKSTPSLSAAASVGGYAGFGKKRRDSRSSVLLMDEYEGNSKTGLATSNPFDNPNSLTTTVHEKALPQPPVDYQPFNLPLAHIITLVTAYSESENGLRTTLDSVATTDYPSSHKLILVICDGLIKGSGNDMSTPDIVLSMMEDCVVPKDEVQPFSYVAVASGSKRHNMAKVYAGFYKYDDNTIPVEKQQQVPMIAIVKCGTPDEQGSAKPGNRGKRDSQIILMSFLQRVMFDERMTELEYEMMNGIWQITGLSPDYYEMVLMVDADTKVYPDSITHMAAQMVKDPQIMGLCGETKIANKRDSWVTMIQVFEYFISHHQAKAFESIFGGVTCLPGCFSMYRIKAPKGPDGYWVPILANPDIVERYADNVVDTLHKKNLLLLGEDRYLSTLMLRTFPKRKQVFVPKAACKTIVPDEFKVLLSQRRRWINSTVHNLMELLLVKDLCGVFCFSMQFVVFIELVGTLVLPAAIAFTCYVIIIAIVSKPTPVMSLILLALILGLPGLLIVVTASRWSYLVWCLIYIFALPIWNFVLPMNAYWKFDDFSWGTTRSVQGEGSGKGHEDGEGEFDSSKIVMKRWRDFEREKRVQYVAQPQAVYNSGGFEHNEEYHDHSGNDLGEYAGGYSDHSVVESSVYTDQVSEDEGVRRI